MQSFQEYAAAATSYTVALIALFAPYMGGIVSLLGFVLLLARLVQELPKAYRVIMRKGDLDDN